MAFQLGCQALLHLTVKAIGTAEVLGHLNNVVSLFDVDDYGLCLADGDFDAEKSSSRCSRLFGKERGGLEAVQNTRTVARTAVESLGCLCLLLLYLLLLPKPSNSLFVPLRNWQTLTSRLGQISFDSLEPSPYLWLERALFELLDLFCLCVRTY